MPGIRIPQVGDDGTRSGLEENFSSMKSKRRSTEVALSALRSIVFHGPLFYLESKSALLFLLPGSSHRCYDAK